MRVPTYLQKENYKIVKEEEDFLTVTIMKERMEDITNFLKFTILGNCF